MAATFASMPSFRVISREPLFSMAEYRTSFTSPPHYDVTQDDQRFVMIRGGTGASELILVQNFFEELRERLPN